MGTPGLVSNPTFTPLNCEAIFTASRRHAHLQQQEYQIDLIIIAPRGTITITCILSFSDAKITEDRIQASRPKELLQ